ncbi:MAG: penicillin-binding transpeptidase domain-containing protein [Solirubrobacteraceae bacterium]
MSDEFDWVRSLRPPVEAASSQARDEALLRLERAMATEQAALDTAPGRASAVAGKRKATRGHARSLDGVIAEDADPRESPRRRRSVSGLGTVVSSLAVVVALVIAGGALVLIHHSPTGSGSSVAVVAARGEILDRSGNVLVGDQPLFDVQINRAALPTSVASRAAEYALLARLVGISNRPVRCAAPGRGVLHLPPIDCEVTRQAKAAAPVTIESDLSPRVAGDVSQDKAELGGVSVKRVYLRSYPYGSLAAQVLGTVGPITAAETHKASYKGLAQTAIVGQSGLEYSYDSYLRTGQNLRTSLNTQLQKTGEAALDQSIASNPPATGGAFVALNPENGEVYAMGSAPTFDPSVFTHRISDAAARALTSPSSNFPLVNRAIDSAGPTGSTFKPITATAALQSGAWLVDDTFDDTGQFCIDGECRHNAGNAVDGELDLVNAIRVSSDDFFYNLGALTDADPVTHPDGGALQQWASAFGIGKATGIDLPGEDSGTLPTPAFRAHQNLLEQECEDATGPYKGAPKHPAADGGCGIAVVPPETWTVGDNINLAVGQGDVQVTPLQLAVVYAALANGSTIVRPHIGLDIQSSDGTVLRKIVPPPARHIDIDPTYLKTIREGLRAAASQPGGTSADVFGSFPEQVYGKTGTAQHNGQQDYAWYACFVPATATNKPIVIVVTVDQGGFGAVAAAPVAREMLSQWFFGKPGPYVAGSSTTL